MKNFNYLPHTEEEIKEMLQAMGLSSTEDLFKSIPNNLKDIELHIPNALTEIEILHRFSQLSKQNLQPDSYISFLGGGYYNRFIPAAVDHITSRAEFLTAYTPYQPEISQGTLQMIYEYQTMICSLTGMDVSNASMYDAATAAAEAVMMSLRITKKNKLIISNTINDEIKLVIQTYLQALDILPEIVGMKQGITDLDNLSGTIDSSTACVIIQVPNLLGCIEKVLEIEKITHACNAMYIVIIDPISSGLLKPPGKYGADIVVGSGQPLGNPLSYGGPGFGFIACKEKYMRQMPGRIVGATVDNQGRQAFTLTLQAREQHIRRDKATSNICTNHSLNALAACVYLSVLGPKGIREIANISFQRAHYLANKLEEIPGFEIPFKNFFSEFVLKLPSAITVEMFEDEMHRKNIIPGIGLSIKFPELKNSMLVSITEANTVNDISEFYLAAKAFASQFQIESVKA